MLFAQLGLGHPVFDRLDISLRVAAKDLVEIANFDRGCALTHGSFPGAVAGGDRRLG